MNHLRNEGINILGCIDDLVLWNQDRRRVGKSGLEDCNPLRRARSDRKPGEIANLGRSSVQRSAGHVGTATEVVKPGSGSR